MAWHQLLIAPRFEQPASWRGNGMASLQQQRFISRNMANGGVARNVIENLSCLARQS
jgi:hypothetical protein